jgi:hypothetical protein
MFGDRLAFEMRVKSSSGVLRVTACLPQAIATTCVILKHA